MVIAVVMLRTVVLVANLRLGRVPLRFHRLLRRLHPRLHPCLHPRLHPRRTPVLARMELAEVQAGSRVKDLHSA